MKVFFMSDERFFKKEYPYDWWFVFDKEQKYTDEKDIPIFEDYVPLSEEQVITLLNNNYNSMKLLRDFIDCKLEESEKLINQQYNLPVGTNLSYWIGVNNLCKKIKHICDFR